MDNKTWDCRNPQCALYGRMAPYAQLKFRGWHRHAVHCRCQVCPGLVSARTGTAYAGIRTAATTYVRGATALAEGMSSRATGRLLNVDTDTVNHWWPVLGAHCPHGMRYFSHSTQFSGKEYHRSSKASRREDLQVEHPI